MTEFFDITRPLIPGFPVWPGDPRLEIEVLSDWPRVSRLSLGSHTGTHLDAPAHWLENGSGTECYPPELLWGPAVVVDGIGNMLVNDLVPLPQGEVRILIRTGCQWSDQAGFNAASQRGLADDLADELLRRGVRLIGIDLPSIEADQGTNYDREGIHGRLLSAGCAVLEGLRLDDVPSGQYELCCAPLAVPGLDGVPARCFLRRLAP